MSCRSHVTALVLGRVLLPSQSSDVAPIQLSTVQLLQDAVSVADMQEMSLDVRLFCTIFEEGIHKHLLLFESAFLHFHNLRIYSITTWL